MRASVIVLGSLLTIMPWPFYCAGQAQTQANPPKCDLPPPLVCPPDPPAGPKTAEAIDSYIGSLDSVIATNEAAAHELGKAPINAYVGELKDYRDRLASYRYEHLNPQYQASQPAAGPP